MANEKLLKAALGCDELRQSLDNISTDDNCDIADYSDAQIVDEAVYVLSCYSEDGHTNCEMLNGEHGDEAAKTAKKEKRQLVAFIKKYGHLATASTTGAAQLTN